MSHTRGDKVVRSRGRRRSLLLSAATACFALLCVGAASAAGPGRDLWVDASAPGCADAANRDQVSLAHPWCTIQAAAAAALAGDTVHVRPGRYLGTIRPSRSGTAAAPIRFDAPFGEVTIDAAGAATGLNLVHLQWVVFQRFTITGASGQGVYVDNARNLTLAQLTIRDNGAYGIQANASALTVSGSTIFDNGMAGIDERAGSSGNSYLENTISGNGHDGKPYNGDGIQLNGNGARVSGNTITDNGDPGIYEHGIYAGGLSSSYVIESNTLSGNAASDIKAAGSAGIIRYNRLGDSRLGLVFSDNPQPVTAYYNVFVGRFQHAVLFTSGAQPARAHVWNNTILQTGRPTSGGDASTVFVNPAGLADIKNNIICDLTPDTVDAVLFVKNLAQTVLNSNNNWFCSKAGSARRFVLSGARTSLSTWAKATTSDRASLSTLPPVFDAAWRVTSPNRGRQRGLGLGLTRDASGTGVPPVGPDIGAFQQPA